MAVGWQYPSLPIYRLRGHLAAAVATLPRAYNKGGNMSVFVIGGTGFIGTRVIRLLAARGEEIVCMDINPAAASFDDLGKQVRLMRGDVTQFDDVMAATVECQAGPHHQPVLFPRQRTPPHVATKLNILGMDNCFEAARLAGVKRVVFASSLAVNGMQKHYGDRMITEDDYRHGEVQYAMHKIFNEWQAQDYNEKYGMTITAVRPANVTGPDKVRGSVDHVNIITQPAQGKPISFPYSDAMRCPIHVDDIAEVFTRVLLTDKPKQAVYNSGGIAISLGEIADIVREFLPDAQISFEHEPAARTAPATT